jgi:hypothetical protein
MMIRLVEIQNKVRKVGVTISILKRLAPMNITRVAMAVALRISMSSNQGEESLLDEYRLKAEKMRVHKKVKPNKNTKF